uniref:Polyadenylate-binding protein n=1 Tax=Acrobeloides nanus TaxID=290746 RepID=A0A914ECD2_9BILA
MATMQPVPIATVLPTPSNTVTLIGNTAAPGNATATALRSLYVGDLHPGVTESQLFEKFSKIGAISSIRVCRDAITRRSLGYAYVNFQLAGDAERAMESMNFELLNGRPIRIMWSQRDPSLRRSTAGNIFIKNLDKRIDVKSLYDTFTLFGKILSCKISMDAEGNSKGYGFIHFESEEAAQVAIGKVNGMLLDEKKVYVAKFQTRTQRFGELGDSDTRFTNVYIKNFAEDLDDEKLKELFSKFGTITSAIVIKDSEGKSRGFGFVAFEKPEEAGKSVEEMNGYELSESKKKLTVCRAQKKAEREVEVKRKYALWKSELEKKCKGSNLYVKNLEETVNDEELRKIFEEFGTITSVKVMRDENGRSRCFGFVCFENAENAAKAKEEKHNKMNGSKPLYVALAQRKEDRQTVLASRFVKGLNQMRMQGPTSMPGTVYTPAGGYFVAPTVQNQPHAFMPAQLRGGPPRWNQMPGYMFQNQNFHMRAPRPMNNQRRTQNFGGQATQRGIGGQYRQQAKPEQVVYPYTTVIAPPPPQHVQVQSVQPAVVPLNSQTLSQATPNEQKQIIGEKLYNLVKQICPAEDIGKITGMLLEMEIGELLHMLDDESYVKAKTMEAVDVLHGAEKLQPQQS